jgi:hypothetical protein
MQEPDKFFLKLEFNLYRINPIADKKGVRKQESVLITKPIASFKFHRIGA